MTSRRDFLKQVSATTLVASATPPWLLWGQSSGAKSTIDVPGEEGMIVRSFRFFDLETPVEDFNSWLTPVPHFFVRNHMHEPAEFSAETFRLTVSGEVEKPLSLTLADLAKRDSHALVNTLECAGNGRGLYRPQAPGIQWAKGAVGTAKFSGPRLRDLLQQAGVKASGKHVMFRGLDEVPGKVPPFIRSIPIEKALDSETLIATHMNSAALTKHHGFPARALVPGWIGAASCKWLTEIKVLDSEFVGNFMNPGYRLPNQPVRPGDSVKPEDTHPVTALSVKSLISSPLDGAKLKPGRVTIRGLAWAGEAEIAKVEVSTDGGGMWSPATLGQDRARYAWRLWSFNWNAKSGAQTIRCRATDTQGRTQPETAVWNPSGYLYNGIDEVKIHVA